MSIKFGQGQKVIRDDFQIKMINVRITNNLQKASENPVCYVRSHTKMPWMHMNLLIIGNILSNAFG